MYIEFCSCQRRILTTGQQRDKFPCDLCQKEKLNVTNRNPSSKANNSIAQRIGTNNINTANNKGITKADVE